MGLRKKTIPRGSRLRVLVVDDSVVIRRLVTHALSEDPAIDVVSAAANGVIALQKIPQCNPDAVTLDVEMPEMNGLETLREIRKQYPGLVVIMFSTLTERGAAATMEALASGANDYVTKAANVGSLDRSMERLRDELVPKIKQFFVFESTPAAAPVPAAVQPASNLSSFTLAPRAAGTVREVLTIGVSTGGPTALAAIMPQFPADFPLPVLIVQHMPPVFTRLLAERLQTLTKLRVAEATDGDRVEPGKVLIAPGDYHMRAVRQGTQIVVRLDQAPPENSCRPAVDVLFRSVCDVWGATAIAAVLTGMGQDGLRGAEILSGAGAYVIAQDEHSSVVWGMPGFVARAGIANAVVDLGQIVPEIVRQKLKK